MGCDFVVFFNSQLPGYLFPQSCNISIGEIFPFRAVTLTGAPRHLHGWGLPIQAPVGYVFTGRPVLVETGPSQMLLSTVVLEVWCPACNISTTQELLSESIILEFALIITAGDSKHGVSRWKTTSLAYFVFVITIVTSNSKTQ